MNHEADRFWQQVSRNLARRSGQTPLTPEEAQKEFESLPDVRLSEAEIDAVIDQVTSGELVNWSTEPMDMEASDMEYDNIEDDVLQLNRNEGQADPETDELLDELRRRALEDEQPYGQEDSTGMDGDSEPPAEGG